MYSITKDTNPKDMVGMTKPPTWVIPSTAMLHLGMAMRNGALKYDPYNWREKKVQASVYLDAIQRHWMAWMAGEKCAQDSGIHHLAHLMACAAILIDAEENDLLIDNRPKCQRVIDLMTELHGQIEREGK